ncbi:DNA primase [Streptomyces sp. 5-8]|uniref:DNA primase n=1 Tax=Streptomyces musisoli TaxID=2802280 RepID=A0ABS1NTE2_9ACTN|nr:MULTISPECIES: DNA primase [Streptomyces]MBL1103366.1 DNA primase [Streptomyces musisoli]MBY8845668.1 DNA primase [Streptomyces sp. SP2-10]
MNRTAMGLAVGAGYLLGRTKKLKMALAVGSLVAGKKMNLSPKMLADVVNQQLKNNPQFKEIGDQLRQDLRGVGKAATGAMAERQMNALADRLHGRTTQVRDQLSGVLPSGSDDEEQGDEDAYEESAGQADADRDEDREEDRDEDREEDQGEDRDRREAREGEPRGKGPAKKAPGNKSPARKAAAKKTAPAKKTAAKKSTAARKAAAKKTASAGNAARRATGGRSKGGDDR